MLLKAGLLDPTPQRGTTIPLADDLAANRTTAGHESPARLDEHLVPLLLDQAADRDHEKRIALVVTQFGQRNPERRDDHRRAWVDGPQPCRVVLRDRKHRRRRSELLAEQLRIRRRMAAKGERNLGEHRGDERRGRRLIGELGVEQLDTRLAGEKRTAWQPHEVREPLAKRGALEVAAGEDEARRAGEPRGAKNRHAASARR